MTDTTSQVTLQTVDETLARLAPYIVRTPTVPAIGPQISAALGDAVVLKLELLQRTGTFKYRGALNNLLNADLDGRGITAVSAGNHAVAVACAAAQLGVDAKIVMQASANPARRALAASFGAEILIEADGPSAFAHAEHLVVEEGRLMVHPFDGPFVTAASGGVGRELMADAGPLDAVIVSVGGGGLIGGVALAVKELDPNCAVYGVEPEGADGMRRSVVAGEALTGIEVATIADSLAPPLTTPHTLALCQRYVDELVTVGDDEMCRALRVIFDDVKLAVEPAGAAALAAAMGPLRDKLAGLRVGIVVCGSCIDADGYAQLLARGSS